VSAQAVLSRVIALAEARGLCCGPAGDLAGSDVYDDAGNQLYSIVTIRDVFGPAPLAECERWLDS